MLARQPGRGLRVRVPRPAHPPGGLSDVYRHWHGPGRYRPRRPGRRRIRPGDEPGTAPLPPPIDAPIRGRGKLQLPRSPKLLIGLGILIAFIVLAIVGPLVAPFNPSSSLSTTNGCRSRRPRPTGWARPMSSRTCSRSCWWAAGARSWWPSWPASWPRRWPSSSASPAGYLGGLADDLLSMLANIFLVMPALPLLIVIFGFLPRNGGSNDLFIGLIIAFTGWAWGARVLRLQTLSLRERDYVTSAQIIGERSWRIIGWEIVPNLLPLVASSFLFTVLYGVGTYTALAFLGLINTEHWSWGAILFWAQSFLGGEQRLLVVVHPGRAGRGPAGDIAGAAELRHRRVHQPAAARGRADPPPRKPAGQARPPKRFVLGLTPVVRTPRGRAEPRAQRGRPPGPAGWERRLPGPCRPARPARPRPATGARCDRPGGSDGHPADRGQRAAGGLRNRPRRRARRRRRGPDPAQRDGARPGRRERQRQVHAGLRHDPAAAGARHDHRRRGPAARRDRGRGRRAHPGPAGRHRGPAARAALVKDRGRHAERDARAQPGTDHQVPAHRRPARPRARPGQEKGGRGRGRCWRWSGSTPTG